MWSIATEKINYNPNRDKEPDNDPNGLGKFLAADVQRAFPTRWFWSDELQSWTRNVAKRTYYTTKKAAEAAVVLVAGMHPALMGSILLLAASDIAIENAMAPKRDQSEEIPF